MTKEQDDDLMIEWCLYGPQQQKEIFEEYRAGGGNPSSKEDFRKFLRDRLNIEGYWKSIGILK